MNSAKEDEKDGDVDVKTRIAPNENTTEYSIEVNALTGEKEIKPAIEVLPKFKCKKTLDEAEFSSQLSEQEAAINEMNVADWLLNRDSFLVRKDMQRKKGRKSVSGRDPKGDKKAKEIRERLLDEY